MFARAVPQLGRLQRQIRNRTITPPPTTIPRTRWSGPVTAHRVFDAVGFELDDLRGIKATVPSATINDVVLTIVGGGLRSYLEGKGELPADPLIAMAPISVRGEAERGAAGNMVSGMFTTLGTDIADPMERLRVVREGTHQSKEFANALGARTLLDMADLMPGGLVGLGARTSARLSLANRMRPVFNTTVTNMPGPRHPLYMAGAQLVAMYGAGMITDGMGLIHPVMSYCGDITISFTSCREMLPDPAHYADCLPDVVRRPGRGGHAEAAADHDGDPSPPIDVQQGEGGCVGVIAAEPGPPLAAAVVDRRPLRAPAMRTRMLEQRVPFELGALVAAAPWLRGFGRGDRHPVLVLPGFMGDDRSTIALRAFIRSWGYWAHGWRLGSNVGPTRSILDGIRDRLDVLHGRHGRPVSLVGWSAGGVFARHLAREQPAGRPRRDHAGLAAADGPR